MTAVKFKEYSLWCVYKYSIVIPEIFLYTSLTNKTKGDKNI